MIYRREIDGLRAIAVLPVILFHAGFEAFSGGFVGVDVFFVISGYLITTIIIGEQQAGTFTLRGFYERRARRILPPLITVMLVCVPFAWLWLPPEDLRHFSESMVAVSVFLSNFFFWNDISYFSAAAELKPLLHTWSLAVEEQYYLIAPLLILLVWPLGFRRLTLTFALIAVVSFLAAEWWILADPAGAFFLLPARAWELMAGALVAMYLWRRNAPGENRPWVQGALALAGLILIGAGVFLLDESTPFPGRYALLPVVGTALIILFASGRDPVGRLLGTRALVGVGLISYSAYLWHQPLFALNRMRTVEAMDPLSAWILIGFTFLLAFLSLRFVEKPFRDRSRFNRRQIARYSVGATFACMVVGGVAIELDGVPQRLSETNSRLYKVSEERNPTGGTCSSFDLDDGIPAEECVPEGNFDTRLLIIGDSHTNAIAHGFMAMQQKSDIGVTQLSRSACMSVPGVSRSGEMDDCARHSKMVHEYIRNDSRHDVVMLVVRWPLNIEGSRFDNREGGVEYGDNSAVQLIGSEPDSEAERKQQVAQALGEQVTDYLELGKGVILVYPVPEVGWNVPYRMMRKPEKSFPPEFASTRYDVFRERNEDTLGMLDGLGADPSLARFRPHEILCDTLVPGRCITQVSGTPLYKDDHHLSRRGGRLMAEEMLPLVRGVHREGPQTVPDLKERLGTVSE